MLTVQFAPCRAGTEAAARVKVCDEFTDTAGEHLWRKHHPDWAKSTWAPVITDQEAWLESALAVQTLKKLCLVVSSQEVKESRPFLIRGLSVSQDETVKSYSCTPPPRGTLTNSQTLSEWLQPPSPWSCPVEQPQVGRRPLKGSRDPLLGISYLQKGK